MVPGILARDRVLPLAGLALAILLWGANWPVMKIGLRHVTPVWFSAVRFATGAVCLFALQAVRGAVRLPTRRDLPFIASIGLLQMMAFTLLGAVAMTRLPAGRSAILSYTTPVWVAPASVLLFHERISAAKLSGILLAAVGVVVLVNPLTLDWHDDRIVAANAMLLAASLCWAVCILHLRYFRADSPTSVLAPWQMMLAALLLAALARCAEGPMAADGSAAFYAAILFVGPLATAFCFVAVNAASGWLPATTMSTAMLGVPVTGVVLSVSLLGERVTPALLIGSGAIAAGILISVLSRSTQTETRSLS